MKKLPSRSDQVGPGHRSRQGSRRRRKKESSNILRSGGKISSPPKLKLDMTAATAKQEEDDGNNNSLSPLSPKNISAPRSASYTSLNTKSAEENSPRNFRACLSSSPCPGSKRNVLNI